MRKSQNSRESGFLQGQKQALEIRLAECMEQRRRALSGLVAIESDELKDSADLASAILHQEVSGDRANSCTEQISKVSRAILNMKNCQYGICNDCEEKIPKKRLIAIPWASSCIACQRAKE